MKIKLFSLLCIIGLIRFDASDSVAQTINWSKSLNIIPTSSGIATFHVSNQDYDANFGYVITGNYVDSVDFDPGVGTAYLSSNNINNYFGFVAMYDTNGIFQWVQSFSDSNNFTFTYPKSEIKFDNSGNIVQKRFGTAGLLISKLSNSGVLLWERTIPQMTTNSNSYIVIDASNNIYATGTYTDLSGLTIGNVSIPPNSNSQVSMLHYLLKLDPFGNEVWLKGLAQAVSGLTESFPLSLTCSPDYKLFVTTETNMYNTATCDFNPSGTPFVVSNSTLNISQIIDSSGTINHVDYYSAFQAVAGKDSSFHLLFLDQNSNVHCAKLNSNGTMLWDVPLTSNSISQPTYMDIQLDTAGNSYISGYLSSGQYDINPSPNINMVQGNNCFIIVLDTLGQFMFHLVRPSSSNSYNLTFEHFNFGLNNTIYFNEPLSVNSSHSIVKMDINPCNYALNLYIDSFQNFTCNQNGMILLGITGGTGPYQIIWSTGDTTNPQTIPVTGTYAAQVTDQNGCTDIIMIHMPGPSSGFGFDLNANIISGSVIPGQTTSLTLNVQNLTCSPTSGIAYIVLDTLVSLSNSTILPDLVSGDTLFWNFVNLTYDSIELLVDLDLLVDSLATLGTPVEFKLQALPNLGDNNSANNLAIYNTSVLSSYDPNDITVSPKGHCNEGYITANQKLKYTIRFQNTGTYQAFNVAVLDSLDSNLGLGSLRVLASSHPMYTLFYPNNILKFVFPNINLADSNSNEPESHGYVVFEIDPVVGLATGTTIENRVGIYFDYNAPVYTNTVLNTIYNGDFNNLPCLLSLDDLEESVAFSVYPNPTSGKLFLSFSESIDEKAEIQVTDLGGREILKDKIDSGQFVDVSELNTGMYILRMHSKQKNYTTRFLKE